MQVTAQKAAIMRKTEAIAQLVEPQAVVDLGATHRDVDQHAVTTTD